jgi:hypothetical protein
MLGGIFKTSERQVEKSAPSKNKFVFLYLLSYREKNSEGCCHWPHKYQTKVMEQWHFKKCKQLFEYQNLLLLGDIW